MSEWKEAFCPGCGLSHGKINIYDIPGKPWLKTDQENFWARTRDYVPKPFGVIKETFGRGTMKLVRYYDIDEDTDGYFPHIKARLLTVVKEWVAKGWLTREEVEQAMGK